MSGSQLPIEAVGNLPTLECRYCHEIKPLTEFRERQDTLRYDSRCKACYKARREFVEKMKRYAPEKPEKCQIEGCDRKAVACDHDPEDPNPRTAFRGWLCRECNTALGLAGDTKKRITGLYQYVMGDTNGRSIQANNSVLTFY